jgi:hypothetical protein
MSPRYTSHGIGGAGNISVDTLPYVDGIAYSPPILTPSKSSRYTTGIGGAGNMRKFETTDVRVAQDLPQGMDHVPVATAAGIGGWGNLKAMRKRREQQKSNNGTPRSSYETSSTVISA